MAVFIQNGHAHRQTARREEVFHADGLFNPQQRLQAVSEVNRSQGIEIADPMRGPGLSRRCCSRALPEAHYGISLCAHAGFSARLRVRRHIPQAEIRHAEIFVANQVDTVQIVSGREVIAPVAHKP